MPHIEYKYTIKAHPTMYDGVCFRSRLEARWAAFFTAGGILWEYEPVDFEGWTPDFRLHFHNNDVWQFAFIEVKPFDHTKDFVGHPAYPGEEGEVLAVGDPSEGFVQTGVVGLTYATMLITIFRKGTFYPTTSWEDIGVAFRLRSSFPLFRSPEDAWKDAGRMVQWKGHR